MLMRILSRSVVERTWWRVRVPGMDSVKSSLMSSPFSLLSPVFCSSFASNTLPDGASSCGASVPSGGRGGAPIPNRRSRDKETYSRTSSRRLNSPSKGSHVYVSGSGEFPMCEMDAWRRRIGPVDLKRCLRFQGRGEEWHGLPSMYWGWYSPL